MADHVSQPTSRSFENVVLSSNNGAKVRLIDEG